MISLKVFDNPLFDSRCRQRVGASVIPAEQGLSCVMIGVTRDQLNVRVESILSFYHVVTLNVL